MQLLNSCFYIRKEEQLNIINTKIIKKREKQKVELNWENNKIREKINRHSSQCAYMKESGDAVASVTCAQNEPALICDDNKAPVAVLPVLMFSGECQLICTVLGCEHVPLKQGWQLYFPRVHMRNWDCCGGPHLES